MTGQRRLALALYRGLLTWARSNKGVPLPLRSYDVYAAGMVGVEGVDLGGSCVV